MKTLKGISVAIVGFSGFLGDDGIPITCQLALGPNYRCRFDELATGGIIRSALDLTGFNALLVFVNSKIYLTLEDGSVLKDSLAVVKILKSMHCCPLFVIHNGFVGYFPPLENQRARSIDFIDTTFLNVVQLAGEAF